MPLTPEFSKRFEEVYKEIAGQGERVLGFARKYLSLVRFWMIVSAHGIGVAIDQ